MFVPIIMKFLLLSFLAIFTGKVKDPFCLLCKITYHILWAAPSYDTNARIIGGVPASIYDYSFAAAINVQTSDSRFFCGGTLYTTQYVITAGQCVNGAALFTIYLGSASLRDPDRLILSTSEYILHPEYDPLTLANDIALIKFRMPIEYTDTIKPVNYLALESLPQGRSIRAIGWGQTSDQTFDLADELKAVYVVSMSNTDCAIIYGGQINDNMVCVEGNYNEGACHGDTGGPLIDIYSRYQRVHVGLSSFFSSNGCESTDPSGYTRTYPYVGWIKNATTS